MKWHFSRKKPSDKTRDPIASEFFSLDAIESAGEALIREGIQNSLDARIEKAAGTARIRIYLSGEENAVCPSDLSPWLDGAWPHLLAKGNGIRQGELDSEKHCSFLAFEDFGTTGLVGDFRCHEPVDGAKNPFFYFFRAEGKTEKSGDDRGRWGVGKQVFPRSSRAQMYFGYTETGSHSLLMGGCILKHHKPQGGDTTYKPDGYFGEQEQVDGDLLTVPTTKADTIRAFCETFNLSRKPGERGLSLVVPWLDEQSTDGAILSGFDRAALLLSVISDYFVPIIEGRLEVTIEDSAGKDAVNSSTFREIIEGLSLRARGIKALEKRLARLANLVMLVESCGSGSYRKFDLNPCSDKKASWDEETLSGQNIEAIRDHLDQGKIARIESTLTIRPRESTSTPDRFSCYLKKISGSEKPCHIREDLLISSVECKVLHGFSALIRIENGPLATLLGDSEGPAHTEWQKSSRNLIEKYINGGPIILFVSSFASELINRIYTSSKERDREILNDLFQDLPIAKQKQNISPASRKQVGQKGEDEGESEAVVEVASKPRFFRLLDLPDGFSIAIASDAGWTERKLHVIAAYDSAKGDPFKCYSPADFDFTKAPIALKYSGCAIRRQGPNDLILENIQPHFSFSASGFDINRDLIVRVKHAGPGIASEHE